MGTEGPLDGTGGAGMGWGWSQYGWGHRICPEGFTAKEVSKNTPAPLNIPVPKNTPVSLGTVNWAGKGQ